ncbi:hypothetical protein K503DRAFT_804977 [Rhizopogon vinicolor AM-OR11-026]|uniref:RRM domain-containing protein n=1 Tax=Rhizopogon vinicolor AM-OR11-026 TaxID=1314800 RepID=A0A1B7MJG3_9AGAM|nr:hypothetical protein K503DRAFT_804977 [Rhizopogon vinicolor AM-OR11-026]
MDIANQRELREMTSITVAEEDGGSVAGGDEPALSTGTTLFVKNLAVSTTVERLTQVFRNLPGFSFARVQTKLDPKRSSVCGAEPLRLSVGYGFVWFRTGGDVKKGMKGMQCFVLDGYGLHVKFAGRGTEDEPKDEVDAKNMMIVKNVPFEATKKDIRELFGLIQITFHAPDITLNSFPHSAHGHLKSVCLSKKFDSQAENAYAALSHTHLLGRHLVLEWAEEVKHDIEVLRKKAGVGYGDGAGAELPGHKWKLDIAEDDWE